MMPACSVAAYSREMDEIIRISKKCGGKKTPIFHRSPPFLTVDRILSLFQAKIASLRGQGQGQGRTSCCPFHLTVLRTSLNLPSNKTTCEPPNILPCEDKVHSL